MEKISGIIPANARTRQVDVSGSQPVRPGAVAWGRPMGKVTKANMGEPIEDRITMREPAMDENKSLTYKRPADAAKVKAIEELSNKFNRVSPKELARENDLAASEQVTENLTEV